jgi:hypothetical protein
VPGMADNSVMEAQRFVAHDEGFAHNFVTQRSFALDFVTANTPLVVFVQPGVLGLIQDSQAWKSMLSNWRLVQAAMPDRPDLEAPFAFMQEYMTVTRSAPPQTPTAQ